MNCGFSRKANLLGISIVEREAHCCTAQPNLQKSLVSSIVFSEREDGDGDGDGDGGGDGDGDGDGDGEGG